MEGGMAAMLVPWKEDQPPDDVEVIHPNQNGDYAKVFQRNKAIRNREKEREARAREWLKRARA
ncbi:unnamed protein product [Discosporangium mesarthrocarpum]